MTTTVAIFEGSAFLSATSGMSQDCLSLFRRLMVHVLQRNGVLSLERQDLIDASGATPEQWDANKTRIMAAMLHADEIFEDSVRAAAVLNASAIADDEEIEFMAGAVEATP